MARAAYGTTSRDTTDGRITTVAGSAGTGRFVIRDRDGSIGERVRNPRATVTESVGGNRKRKRPPMDAATRAGFEQLRRELG